MNNSFHGSTSSNEGGEGGDDAFINESPDGMENYVEDVLFPMLDEGSLDHAILESLFYNEISLLSNSSGNHNNNTIHDNNAQTDILSTSVVCDTDSFLLPSVPSDSLQYSNSALHQQSRIMSVSNPLSTMTSVHMSHLPDGNSMITDAKQEAEVDLFGNFGVAPSNVRNSSTATPDSHPSFLADTMAAQNIALQSHPVSSRKFTSQQTVLSSSSVPRKPSVQLPKHSILNGGGIRHNVVPVLDKNDTERTELPPSTAENTTKVLLTNPSSPTTEEKKRKKLISQFATLAGRLGITLPPQVLQKLTDKAADATKTESVATTMTQKPNPILSASLPAPSNFTETLEINETPSEKAEDVKNDELQPPQSAQPVLLQQVQKSALEAIAAVDNKRSNTAAGVTTNTDDVDSPIDSKPYSKKRKKPRLSDCEQKLAELQSENIILKRHLDNIANRNARLDEDRMTAEKQMRQLLNDNAPDSILDPIVKNFTEMYSDYGRKRHDELNFHLQQLQRLANPTNFTKMGLWTLGGGVQSSSTSSTNGSDGGKKVNSPNGSNAAANKNPIAGMLQRELGISAQQGRKIIDQRQKIQNVCSNLKECLKLLAKLNQLCEKKTEMFHNRMTKCQQVLAPKQVVKLLIWIDDNSQTLGTVCPGWGSEQFQSKVNKTKKDALPK